MVACLGIRLPDLCGYQVMEKWQPQFALVRDSDYLHGVNIGHLTVINRNGGIDGNTRPQNY